jgi:hypothetical protein
MRLKYLLLPLPLFLTALSGQSTSERNAEGFKTATVSDFLSSKYTWEKQEEEAPQVVAENKTPFKPVNQKLAEREAIIEARLRPTLDIDDPISNEDIPEDELGLDTVQLREFQVSELYSPLMRMSEMKDLDSLKPGSGGAFLSEEYYSNLENQYLNRWHIPLIGKSQEQLAKEKYQQEQYQNFLGEVSNTIEGIESLNPGLSKELKKEFRETQHQYNNNNKTDDLRYTGPDAKF